jgi:hypothetical protein
VLSSEIAINNAENDEKILHSNEMTEESQKKMKPSPREESEQKIEVPRTKSKEQFLNAYNLIFGEDSEDQVSNLSRGVSL